MMKKIISILLVVMLLCGSLGVAGASAATPPVQAQAVTTQSRNAMQNLANAALTTLLNSSMGDLAITAFVNAMKSLQNRGFDVESFLDSVDHRLPMPVKAALHDAGVKSYPIWERDMMFYLIFRYLLFGWFWM